MDTIEDFAQKYLETYFKYKNSIVYLLKINFSTNTIRLKISKDKVINLKYPDELNDLDLSTPKLGYFNYNKHALFLYRHPGRQWKKGFSLSNHKIVNPVQILVQNVSLYKPIIDLKLAKIAFKNTIFQNIGELITRLDSKKIFSGAISSNLALSQSLTKNIGPLIWYGPNPVGYIENSKFVLRDLEFSQEVHDELNRLGKPEWIF